MLKKIGFTYLIIIVLFSFLGYRFFYSMNSLPDGELISEIVSPDDTYTIRIYLVNTHATVAYSIKGELVFNNSNITKNIYWGYRESEAAVEWIDDDTVMINKRSIEVPDGKYDWRREN